MFVFGLFFEDFVKSNLIRLVCINYSNTYKEYVLHTNSVFNYLRGFDGVYFSGKSKDKAPKSIKCKNYIEYEMKIVNKDLQKWFIHIKNKSFRNIKEMEKEMAGAPYKMWSLISLIDELKRRKVSEPEYKGVTDKDILVELLEKLDAKKQKQLPQSDLPKHKTKKKKGKQLREENDEVVERKSKKDKSNKSKTNKKDSVMTKKNKKAAKGSNYDDMNLGQIVQLARAKGGEGFRPMKEGMNRDDMINFLKTGKKVFSAAKGKTAKAGKDKSAKAAKKNGKVKLPMLRIEKLEKIFNKKYADDDTNWNAKLKKLGLLNSSTKKLEDSQKFTIKKLSDEFDEEIVTAYIDSL